MKKPPMSGFGLHDYILEESRNLVLEGLSQGTIERRLFDVCHHCGRPFHILQKEIHDATCGALEWAGNAFDEQGKVMIAGRGKKPVEWLPVNVQRQSDVLYRMGLYSYKTLVGDRDNDISQFCYEDLFAGINFNVCCAMQMNRPVILPLSEWLEKNGKMEAQQFVVPNPMLEKGGRKSNNNTHKQLYQIVEFDFKEGELERRKDKQAKLIRYLMSIWALSMVVWSGSKSLHAWFPCYHKTDRQIRNFVRLATELGADRQMRIPCQYCRMPNGTNYKTGSRQEVIYYDADIISQHNAIVQEDLCGGEEEKSEEC